MSGIKKTIAPLICLCLLLSAPAGAEVAPLTAEELFAFRDTVWQWARDAQVRNDPLATHDPDGADTWLYAFDFGLLELSRPELAGADNPVQSIELLAGGAHCPRGIAVGDSLGKVLEAYANENQSLTGDAAYAALYAHAGERQGEAAWGWVLRKKETVECVQYAVSAPSPDMEGRFLDLNLRYVIEDGRVISIRATGFEELITGEEAEANLSAVRDAARRNGFAPTLGSEEWGKPFNRNDLLFLGIDFAFVKLEDMTRALGEPLAREYSADGTLLTLVYENAVLECGRQGEGWRAAALLVTGGGLSGPRGIEVGDGLHAIQERFGNVENVYEGDGTLTFSCESATGEGFGLLCTFANGILTEYLVYRT